MTAPISDAVRAALELNPVDRRIWQEELDDFVPQRVYDAHSHIYRWSFNLDPAKESSGYRALLGDTWAEAGWKELEAVDRALMPGREVHRLSFPFPFPKPCDFDGSNQFLADEIRVDPESAGLMLAAPGMDPEKVEGELERLGMLGFKPYRFYSQTGDAVECGIADFMPEPLLEIASRRKLLVMMHLSRRDAIADPRNLADLETLSARYPGVRWILAHCARSYSAWAVERAAPRLRALPNLWYDTSSVCETDALDALYSQVGWERVMYGSDDVPVGVLRGKYVAFGYAWAYLSPDNHSLGLSHCDGRMTFTRYEQLRAMRRAGLRLGLTRAQTQAVFYDTAARLIAAVRAGVEPDATPALTADRDDGPRAN